MIIVLFIFILATTPVKIRPRMLTLPVNGHFLSMYVPSTACHNQIKDNSNKFNAAATPTSLTK